MAPGTCYGRLDVPVADPTSVAALAERLASFPGTIWTSPARRCRAVAEALASRRVQCAAPHRTPPPGGPHVADPGCNPPSGSYPALGRPVVDGRLQELDFGDWEGLAWDAIPREALDAWAADLDGFAPPSGETGAALVARIRAFAGALPPGDHIVVTHGGPLKILPAILRGEPVDLAIPAPGLGSITLIAREA